MRAIVHRDDEIEAALPHTVADRSQALVEGQAHCGSVVRVRDIRTAMRRLPVGSRKGACLVGTSFAQVDNALTSPASMRPVMTAARSPTRPKASPPDCLSTQRPVDRLHQ